MKLPAQSTRLLYIRTNRCLSVVVKTSKCINVISQLALNWVMLHALGSFHCVSVCAVRFAVNM